MTITSDQDTFRYATPDQAPPIMSQPIDANVIVYAGTVAITRAGLVNPSDSPLSTDVVWGIVDKQTDNRTGSFFGGGASATQVPIDRGTFWLSYTGAMAQSDVDATVYLSDALTVTKTQGSLPVAGTVLAVDTTISKVAVALGVRNKGAVPGAPF
jgi:hypothetical protein